MEKYHLFLSLVTIFLTCHSVASKYDKTHKSYHSHLNNNNLNHHKKEPKHSTPEKSTKIRSDCSNSISHYQDLRGRFHAAVTNKFDAVCSYKTCCSEEMFTAFSKEAIENYNTVLFEANRGLMNKIHATASQIKDLLDDSLSRVAKVNTERMLHHDYHVPLHAIRLPLDDLFLDLRTHLTRRDVNVYESFNDFFDQLFPVAFRYALNDKDAAQELSEEFKDCLIGLRVQLKPFGDVPGKLSHAVAKALAATGTFLDTLRLAGGILNDTVLTRRSESCETALVRMSACAHCAATAQVLQPCRGLCLNVARGCLAGVAEFDRHWAELVDLVMQAAHELQTRHRLDEMVGSMHRKIEEGLMKAMATAYKFYPKVLEKCGKVATHQTSHRPKAASAKKPKYVTLSRPVQPLLQTIVRELRGEKDHFFTLSEAVCNNNKYRATSKHCWNGTAVGRYEARVAGPGIDEQLQLNKEVEVKKDENRMVMALSTKILHMKKLVNKKILGINNPRNSPQNSLKTPEKKQKVAAEKMLGDSPYGSGNYGYHGYHERDNMVDDEDYDDDDVSGDGGYYGGSGSGHHDPVDDYDKKKHFDHKNGHYVVTEEDDIYMKEDPVPDIPYFNSKDDVTAIQDSQKASAASHPAARPALLALFLFVLFLGN